jgi:transcriptional regulator with XRE-family HTH domain
MFYGVDICQVANYNFRNMNEVNLGLIIKRQRVAVSLTLRKLAVMSGVSSSHLGRIERGERFPSAHILRRIAKPLGFDEDELFTLAGYLSPRAASIAEHHAEYFGSGLDPYVAHVLAQEPPEVQRAVIAILSMLKSIARGMTKEKPSPDKNAAATQ